MTRGSWISGIAIVVGILATVTGIMPAQSPEQPRNAVRPGREQLPRPVFRVAQQLPGAGANAANPPQAAAAQLGEHPLVPALQMAYAALTNIRNTVKDYSCTMVKHERINGKLNDQEFMFLKVRHEPFSVYMYFLGPERIKGQEALYVEGKNNGNLLGHGVGIRKIAGTVPLLPTGAMAMQGQRYPITEIGMYNLTRRLVEVGERDKNFGECEVKFFAGAKINKRLATCIQVVHPMPRRNFTFNMARIYVDEELNLPIRYEAYDWPEKPGGPPLLIEEYTYMDVKLNNGFTDADFDENNRSYGFH
ncbi:MAG: DUF1571 domain-containing protein [Planctomycetia bacterium]|nr:DUF1571 domain-containing protein [Planctomycetia bacterium]